MEWLNALPPTQGTTEHTCTVALTLPFCEWLMIRETSVRHNMTMEEVIAHILRESDDLATMSTEGK
jgi:hypothetical protein